MPEYTHPGVYIEEIERGPRPIEGVPTSTAAFLGEAERGPLDPQLITSYTDFERTFGGVFAPQKYLPHSVSGFFENGGKRAFVCRVAGERADPSLEQYEAGLKSLESVREIALVYAPNAPVEVARAIVTHCEKARYRFAVVDCEEGQSDAAMLNPRIAISESRYGAFYYPWIVAMTPGSNAKTLTPPGGHVLGIYARTDTERGVFKAPSNEVVRGAIDVEFEITRDVQEVLNPRSVNVIRNFPERGIRVWGARTLAADPEWKYVNVRRYFNFLERSIDNATRLVVFEPNDEPLWRRVIDQVSQFLLVQWRDGALLGQTERQAFFVKCDRSTMTQDDIDNGRLVCEIGVAVVRPAEFVILRIFQRTLETSP